MLQRAKQCGGAAMQGSDWSASELGLCVLDRRIHPSDNEWTEPQLPRVTFDSHDLKHLISLCLHWSIFFDSCGTAIPKIFLGSNLETMPPLHCLSSKEHKNNF